MCLLWNLLASKLLFALYKLYSWFAHLKELIWLCEWPSFGLGVGIIWLQVQAQVCRLLSYKETVLLLRRVFRQIASDPTTLAHDTGNYWTFLSCWRDVFWSAFSPCQALSGCVPFGDFATGLNQGMSARATWPLWLQNETSLNQQGALSRWGGQFFWLKQFILHMYLITMLKQINDLSGSKHVQMSSAEIERTCPGRPNSLLQQWPSSNWRVGSLQTCMSEENR